jgi:hypothetical protein
MSQAALGPVNEQQQQQQRDKVHGSDSAGLNALHEVPYLCKYRAPVSLQTTSC